MHRHRVCQFDDERCKRKVGSCSAGKRQAGHLADDSRAEGSTAAQPKFRRHSEIAAASQMADKVQAARMNAFITLDCDVHEVPEHMVRTPKAWTPPWAMADVQEIDSDNDPGVAQTEPFLDWWSAELAQLSPTKSPDKVARMLNELLPLHKTSKSLVSTFLTAKGLVKAKAKFMDAHARASRREKSEPPPDSNNTTNNSKWTVTNATGRVMPNVTLDAEVIAFRNVLAKSHGNLTRAFKFMTQTAKSALGHGSKDQLTFPEFEWFVVSFFHYGARSVARRLFSSLDVEGNGFITLWEFVQPPPTQKGLMSLIEFRRRLLERHKSLRQAFGELEDYLDKGSHSQISHHGHGARAMPLPEFVNATRFFGLDAEQATHFFSLMDVNGDGNLTLDEFLGSLTKMPKDVLLYDLRQRLLGRYGSIGAAFQQAAGPGNAAARLDQADLEAALLRLGVEESEAAELFQIMDEDGSGDLSLQELQDAVRSAAPSVNLTVFWQRFSIEWPEIVAWAHDGTDDARQRARLMLADLIPADILQVHGDEYLPGDRLRRAGAAEACQRTLVVLKPETFDSLAVLLDISRSNAMELFRCIVEAAGPQPVGDSGDCNQGMLIYVEDFLEQVKLWTEESLLEDLNARESRDARKCIRTAIAPARAAVSALKAELTPPPTPVRTPLPPLSAPPSRAGARARHKQGEKLPGVVQRFARHPSPQPFRR